MNYDLRFLQTEKLKDNNKKTKDKEKKGKDKEVEDLNKILHNGYSSEQEKNIAKNLPGVRLRKRQSVGE